jgi:hypothetical protein
MQRADSRIRTDDLIITNDLLYQLSYIGIALLMKASIFGRHGHNMLPRSQRSGPNN